MKTALILSHLNDAHAAAAAWALRQVGVDARYECLVERLAEPEGASVNETGCISASALDGEPDLVWFRKPSRPVHLPGSDDAGPDRLHVLANMEETFNTFAEGIEAEIQGSVILNRPDAVRRASNKIINMRAAREAGLSVPETLVTNSMSRGHAFASALGGEVVYKPLRHNLWNIKANIYSPANTAVVNAKTLAESEETDLAFILQKLIFKAAEWRVVYMRGHVYIFQQTRSADGPVDWRKNARDCSEFEQLDADQPFTDCVKRLAEALSINIFTMDCAIDADGDIHFLDLNPSGQFLYLEEWRPEFPLLARLCAALCDLPANRINPAEICMSRFRALNEQRPVKPRLMSSDLVGQTSRKSLICGRLS